MFPLHCEGWGKNTLLLVLTVLVLQCPWDFSQLTHILQTLNNFPQDLCFVIARNTKFKNDGSGHILPMLHLSNVISLPCICWWKADAGRGLVNLIPAQIEEIVRAKQSWHSLRKNTSDPLPGREHPLDMSAHLTKLTRQPHRANEHVNKCIQTHIELHQFVWFSECADTDV